MTHPLAPATSETDTVSSPRQPRLSPATEAAVAEADAIASGRADAPAYATVEDLADALTDA